MIDKNEAPEGYIAIKEQKKDMCTGCAFSTDDGCSIKYDDRICTDCDRKDKTGVIFIKKPVDTKGISGILNINVSFTGAFYNVTSSFSNTYEGSSSPFSKQDISKQYILKENVTEDIINKAVHDALQNVFSGKGVINAEA